MLRDLPPAPTKNTGKHLEIYKQRAKQITTNAPTPYGSIPSRLSTKSPLAHTAKKKPPSSSSSSCSAVYAPYPYFDNDMSKQSSSLFTSLLGRLLSALPTSASTDAPNNNSASPVVGFMPRSSPIAAPPLDVSLPITIASSNDTATDDSCSCLSTSLSSSCGSLSSSVTSTTTCNSCSSIMSASLFLASEDSLTDLLCDRYRQPKDAKVGAVDVDMTFQNKALPSSPLPPSNGDDGKQRVGDITPLSPSTTLSPVFQKPSARARDLRSNGAHLRMIVAEANMMRADKIIGPLRPRGSLPRRSDEFVPSKQSLLRYQYK